MEKSNKMNIVLAILLIATASLLAYTLKDSFASKNQAANGSHMSLGAFDEAIMKNGLALKADIGKIGSQHIHADIRFFVNGKPLNFADAKYYMKSSFLHVDVNQNPVDASGVLHMHSTNVPLWVFANSVGMDFNKDCITLENNERFCNDANKKMKFYVNGNRENDFENYVFKDLDKILVSYGDETGQKLIEQIKSVTDYAKNH